MWIVLFVNNSRKNLRALSLAALTDAPSGQLPTPLSVEVGDVVLPQLGDTNAPLVFVRLIVVTEILYVDGVCVHPSVQNGLP